MATQPSTFLNWTNGAAPNVIAPPTALQISGWMAGQAPPYEYMNWLFWLTDQWIQYFASLNAPNPIPNIRILTGSTFTFSATTGVLTWSAGMNLSIPSVPDSYNTLAAGSVTLTDGQVGYVTANLPITASGNTTTGSNQITNMNGTAGITVGMLISGTGIPTNTTVTTVSSSNITMSANSTAGASGASFQFVSNAALTVTAIANTSFSPTATQFVIARRFGNVVYFGFNGSAMVVRDGESKLFQANGFLNTFTVTAGQTLTAGQAIYIATSADSGRTAGQAYPTDAGVTNALNRSLFAGFVMTGATSGTTAIIVASGSITFSSLTAGTTYFLDPATIGGITATKPTVNGQAVVSVGLAINATTLLTNDASTGSGGGSGPAAIAPTVQRFLSGSGTYTTPVGVAYITVKVLGGGAGGNGTGSGGGIGVAGVASSFGGTLVQATAGSFFGSGGGNAPGPGGVGSATSPALLISSVTGGTGGAGYGSNTSGSDLFPGSTGGNSFLGGISGAANSGQPGNAGAANSGAGGSSGGTATSGTVPFSGSGSGGGYAEAVIVGPATSYAYVVGTGGAGGTAGTSGFAGGAGGSGIVIVTEYYAPLAVSTMAGGATPATITKFTTSGTFSYSPPAGLAYAKITVVGGGGGGAGATGVSFGAGGGGGGAGGTSILHAVSITGPITVTVGVGGPINSGGGNSSFGSLCIATGGGTGGVSTGINSPGAGGVPGIGTVGDQLFQGSSGFNGTIGVSGAQDGMGGNGGSSTIGGGGMGALQGAAGISPGGNFGGGGGGANGNNTTPQVGAGGAVFIEEFYANGAVGSATTITGKLTAANCYAPTITALTNNGTAAGYLFRVASANATAGATYTNNGSTFTVLDTIVAGVFLAVSGTGTLSGTTLTKTSGTGDATIAFSAGPQTMAAITSAALAPSATPLYFKVTTVGGGGGGAGTANNAANPGGGGGGAGGVSTKWIPASTFGATRYYTVAAAGVGGAGSAVGGTGGISALETFSLATGGTGGAPGIGTNGQVAYGGFGGNSTQGQGTGLGDIALGGGGGACGGPGIPSVAAGNGGNGGSNGWGGGGIGSSNVSGTNIPSAGINFGGGGGGAPGGNNAGQPGAQGLVFIETYYQ